MDTSTPWPPVSSPIFNPAPRTIQIEFPQHSSSLLESLNRHRLEGKFCDVSLMVQGRELRAHKAVLAAASPYFHDKLLLGDAPRLTLPSVIEADAFEGLLQLIYSGRLHLPLHALPAHLLVASGLQMWQVVDQCSEILRELETSGGGISAHGVTPYHTLLSTTSSPGGWCIRSPFQTMVQSTASTDSPVGGEGSELGEVLQIQVKEEEEEEEEEEEDEDQGSAALSQTPQPQRVSGGFPHSHGSHHLPLSATPHRLPEGESAPPEPPAPPALPPKIIYIKQEPFEPKEELSRGGTQSGGAKEETKVFPGGDGDLGFLLPSGAGTTSGGGGPSWKPVDLHGNEILSRDGGPGGMGQAVHGPVKLGGAPPADGKCFGCLCGKRFAVKPKRDRHIMLTFSLRPFGCGICNKRFKLKHHLTEHMKTHAGALYACPHCGRRFRVHAYFLRHQDLCKGQGWATAHWTYK
ncbi:zinc finger and BTB domain-containing protein 9 [Choloepus didactylus]|uniref:zinc finger and BTB domain-containing protein 9 n=1 Tax=Choloepus didactylus TaxID=27675 RepID=UPI00189EF727|nr:zinc finger and BTB domain-containing protein 9 [Choloepus didactylus]XP_037698662.1 zinc finger and BTB domain-containing protein 9 [Choloepus didactylus]XP_037698663.1 zinc finger and BTB domain-containing protein 9 [Choloepus didactylus]XP_037698664.1 zinc finger and BTB domain-containing protein 9 [Choloepus didactylus]